MSDYFIRTTSHSFNNSSNKDKHNLVKTFIQSYKEAVIFYIDYLWDTKILWSNKTWDRTNNLLDCPSMISTNSIIPDNTILSARSLKCAATQACSIVKAVVDKRHRDINKLEWLLKHNKSSKSLLDSINKPLSKPNCKNIKCEINSICAQVEKSKDTTFDMWVRLSSLFNTSFAKRGTSILIPIRHHKQSKKWETKGTLLGSFLLSTDSIELRYKIQKPNLKDKGNTIALDQGLVTCLTSSDEQTSKKCSHGHDLHSIVDKLSHQKKGSKSFKQAQEHRKNYINWTVKKLNFSGVSEVKLEDIKNINFGRNVSRTLKHFTNTLIRDSLQKMCEENGVRFTLVPNEYNSQRCSRCGWTQKSNRKGKIFCCQKCVYTYDADYNASQNILVRDTLYDLPYVFRSLKMNLKGFYWNSEGLFLESCEEFTVSHATNLD